MVENSGRGKLIVVSGPSGSGKSTIVKEVLHSKEFPIDFSVSATSRLPRNGEANGKDYFFVTRPEFEKMRLENGLLEWAEVHGNLYGTPIGPVKNSLENGKWILLEIDVQGHRQVKKLMPECWSFFIRAPNDEEYRSRLQKRGTETEADFERRLQDAKEQLKHASEYDFQILNESVPQAVNTFKMVLLGIQARK